MLAEFTAWLIGLVKAVFTALWDFLVDVFVNAVDLVVSALVGLVSAVPVPQFMADGLQSIYGAIDPAIGYILTATGVPIGLSMIGTAYGFRLVRKIVTLFQW
jgi:hypothetical protein